MKKNSALMTHVLMVYALFQGLSDKIPMIARRNFNRDLHNNYTKNSSSNMFRGLRIPFRGYKKLSKAHFGNFSPRKPL